MSLWKQMPPVAGYTRPAPPFFGEFPVQLIPERNDLGIGGGPDWRSILDAVDDHVCLMEPSGRIVFINEAWRRFALDNGYDAEDGLGLGRNYRHLCVSAPTPEAALFATLFDKVASGREASGELLYPCHSPAERRWFRLRLSRVPGMALLIASHQNVSAIKVAADLDVQASLVDEATGMLSRRGFIRAVEDNRASGVAPWAVLVISLEDFPGLVTQHGRGRAEEMMRRLADRLRRNAPAQAVIGHIGGRDLAVALPAHLLGAAPLEAAAALAAPLSTPVEVGGRILSTRADCGLAVADCGVGVPALIDRADLAVGEARRNGTIAEQHSPAIQQRAQRALVLASELRHAVAREQLALHYQPQIDGTTLNLVGVEALMRWHHPDFGRVSPGEFVPLAETSGFVGELTRWALDETCRQVAEWRRGGIKTVPVAVNISGCDLKLDGFVDMLTEAVARHGLEPRALELELTESMLVQDQDSQANRNIERLVAAGYRFAVDDFGTGYSNLAYLRRLSLGKLKIDRSFVTDIESARDAAAIAEAIVRIAHALGIEVLAEGVETAGQHRKLLELGCRQLQGYLFGQPAEPAAIARRLTER